MPSTAPPPAGAGRPAVTPSPATPSARARSWPPAFFGSAAAVYGAAAALRLVLLVYGLWQDGHSPVKYTDIDYLVFTDAARFVVRGQSPYDRATYRYTPLLAWLLTPAGRADSVAHPWAAAALFASGKVLFAVADLAAGWLLERVLVRQLADDTTRTTTDTPAPATSTTLTTSTNPHTAARARLYASVWLLNPMVATISTRGSSEGLLGALVALLLWAVQVTRRPGLAGVLLGLGVHLKIYPFIYAPAIVWWMDAARMHPERGVAAPPRSLRSAVWAFATADRLRFALASLATFAGLNAAMLVLYGFPFLQHTFLHHVTRIDHRHNFSPYNTLLYQSSAGGPPSGAESLAFVPQLLLSAVLIPLAVAKRDLATCMLVQTFAFVTFNKVCTSQYFLWYMVLLPVYLPQSPFVRRPRLGLATLALWVASQAVWLQQGFALEFLGRSTFVPGLWLASLGFFAVNVWILGVMVASNDPVDSKYLAAR